MCTGPFNQAMIIRFASLLLAILCYSPAKCADSNLGITWTTVGDVANTADPLTGLGNVDYAFRIAKHNVTNAQYTVFLNSVATLSDPYSLYNTDMAGPQPSRRSGNGGIIRTGAPGQYSYAPRAGHEQSPVCYVSFYDAVRLANWLHNGGGLGSDTESGAYSITTTPTTTTVGARESSARYFLPSEDEWYKSAYYKGGSSNSGYWRYPTKSDSPPASAPPPGSPPTANTYSESTGFAQGYRILIPGNSSKN